MDFDIFLNSEKPVILTGPSLDGQISHFYRSLEQFLSNQSHRPRTIKQLFSSSPKLVWNWFEPFRQQYRNKKPSQLYYKLQRLQDFFSCFTIITQNVTSDHIKAGSDKVYELFGNCNQAFCCNSLRMQKLPNSLSELPPKCNCGNDLLPNILGLGGGLSSGILYNAFSAISSCDLLILLGAYKNIPIIHSFVKLAKKRKVKVIEVSQYKSPFSDLVNIHLNKSPSFFLDSLFR